MNINQALYDLTYQITEVISTKATVYVSFRARCAYHLTLEELGDIQARLGYPLSQLENNSPRNLLFSYPSKDIIEYTWWIYKTNNEVL